MLCVYLHKLPEEVGELTLVQFRSLLSQLGRKFNWQVALAVVPAGGKLDDQVHPLHPSINKVKERGKFNKTSLESFIKSINMGR